MSKRRFDQSETSQKQQSSKTESRPSSSFQVPTLHAVLDTNIFLHRTKYLKHLLGTPLLGGKPLKVIVPWTVLQELDGLKKNKQNLALSDKANAANTFINQMLMSENPYLQGQSAVEARNEVNGWCPSDNDDKILHCCLQVQEKNPKIIVILLSDDKNLCSKARVSNVKSYMWDDFLRRFKIKFGEPDQLPSQKNAASHVPDKSNDKKSNVLDQGLHEIVGEMQQMLMDQLVPILEKEVKAAYDDIWKLMLPVKPPWTLIDVFTCFIKLWGGVFGLVLPRRLVDTFVKLKSQFANKTHYVSESNALETVALVENLFLEIHKSYGKHHEILRKINLWKRKLASPKLNNDNIPKSKAASSTLTPKKEENLKRTRDNIEKLEADNKSDRLTNAPQTEASSPGKIKRQKLRDSPYQSRPFKVDTSRTTGKQQYKPAQKTFQVTKKNCPLPQKNVKLKCSTADCMANFRSETVAQNNRNEMPGLQAVGTTRNELNASRQSNKKGDLQTVAQVSSDSDNVLQLFNYVWQVLNHLCGLALDCIQHPHNFAYVKPATVPSRREAVEFLPKLSARLSELEATMKSALTLFSNEAMTNFLHCLKATVPSLMPEEPACPAHVDLVMLKSFCENPQNREMLQNGYNQLFNFLTSVQQCVFCLK